MNALSKILFVLIGIIVALAPILLGDLRKAETLIAIGLGCFMGMLVAGIYNLAVKGKKPTLSWTEAGFYSTIGALGAVFVNLVL